MEDHKHKKHQIEYDGSVGAAMRPDEIKTIENRGGRNVETAMRNIVETDDIEIEDPVKRRIPWIGKTRMHLIILLEVLEAAGLIKLNYGNRNITATFLHYNFTDCGKEITSEMVRRDKGTIEWKKDHEDMAVELLETIKKGFMKFAS